MSQECNIFQKWITLNLISKKLATLLPNNTRKRQYEKRGIAVAAISITTDLAKCNVWMQSFVTRWKQDESAVHISEVRRQYLEAKNHRFFAWPQSTDKLRGSNAKTTLISSSWRPISQQLIYSYLCLFWKERVILILLGCIHLLNTRKYCDTTCKYFADTHMY